MSSLHRIAFCLKIQSSDYIDEYIDRHNPIWPELSEVFREHGVSNYSIFINRKTLELFGFAEVRSLELWESIAQTGACRKWWAYMADIMVNNDDGTPWSQPLEEVFHHEISEDRT